MYFSNQVGVLDVFVPCICIVLMGRGLCEQRLQCFSGGTSERDGARRLHAASMETLLVKWAVGMGGTL